MKLTVLMDNHTEIDVYHLGEPAVSYWLEADGKRFLFDTGYSDAFLKNAKAMGIDLTTADAILLSHGHNDHTGGLPDLLSLPFSKKPRLIAHPHALLPKHWGTMDIGSPLTMKELQEKAMLEFTEAPLWLTDHLVFLGEIPHTVDFEPAYAIGETIIDGQTVPDIIDDDTALAYVTDAGIYIITGCSHAGICNIIQYAKAVTGKTKVLGLLGGLHLMEENERSQKTVDFLAKEQISALYPCHCTAFPVRAALHAVSPIQEVAVGMTLEWE